MNKKLQLVPIILILSGYLAAQPKMVSVKSEFNSSWSNVCPNPDIFYCNDINKNAYNSSRYFPVSATEFKLGKIIGVTWRPKGSLIGYSPAIPKANIPEEYRLSPRDAYYYIIDDGFGKPFVRQGREIDAK